MVPEEVSAAKALSFDAIDTKPLPVGAPIPPYILCPHALMVPEEVSAANA